MALVEPELDLKSRLSSIESALDAIDLSKNKSIDQFISTFNRFYAANREYFNLTNLFKSKSIDLIEAVFNRAISILCDFLKNDFSLSYNALQFLINSLGLIENDYFRAQLSRIFNAKNIFPYVSAFHRQQICKEAPKYEKIFIKNTQLVDTQFVLVDFLVRFMVDFTTVENCLQTDILIKIFEFLIDALSIGFIRKYVKIFIEEFHLFPVLLNRLEDAEKNAALNCGLKSEFLSAWCFAYDHLAGAGSEAPVDAEENANRRIFAFQKTLFLFSKEPSEASFQEEAAFFCTLSCKEALKESHLKQLLDVIPMHDFCKWLGIRSCDANNVPIPREQLQNSLMYYFSCYLSVTPSDRSFFSSNLPTEKDLFGIEAIEDFFQDDCPPPQKKAEKAIQDLNVSIVCPKIGVQFLNLRDFLSKNRRCLEFSACIDIKNDVVVAVEHLKPFLASDGTTAFAGWSKHCAELEAFSISSLQKASVLDENDCGLLSRVTAEVVVDLSKYSSLIQASWNNLRENEVLFFLTVAASDRNFKISKAEVVNLRGAVLRQIMDCDGNTLPFEGTFESDLTSARPLLKRLKLVVDFDPVQYTEDLAANAEYLCFNLLLKRNPRENNFKPSIDWITSLLRGNDFHSFPAWFKASFLGFGDSSASAALIPSACQLVDFFADSAHCRRLLPEWSIPDNISTTLGLDFETKSVSNVTPTHSSESHRSSSFQFSATQFDAVVKGLSHGVNLVVGPPGTGKTDVAVQIAMNLYCSHPTERVLLLTHSNEALNVLMRKLSEKEKTISPLHVMRLGHGADDVFSIEENENEFARPRENFSKYGRLAAWLSHKDDLLAEVEILAKSLGYSGDFAYTAETAGYFFDFYIKPVIASYKSNTQAVTPFPFEVFFTENAVFMDEVSVNVDSSDQKIAYICRIFDELRECRPLEVLSSNADRANFIFSQKSRIVAMTSTFLAIKQEEIRALGITFDSLIVEEASQILEIDCSLPFFVGGSALKRITFLGDHFQLPPIVKSQALQKQSHFDQSLFVRLLRLGSPAVQFEAQTRCRPEIARLFAWKYRGLESIWHEAYNFANPGFHHSCQFVNVPALNGVGETEPTPAYFQNEAEAEFIVAVYQFMRAIGYPADSVAILTPYNGQKALIREIATKRCALKPEVFGDGSSVLISTIDKFQGRQAPIVLLSLVRTESSVGHLADLRRFIVAVSRASLGLYIFGRASLFFSSAKAPAISKILTDALPHCTQEKSLLLHFPAHYTQKIPIESSKDEAEDTSSSPISIADAVQMSLFVRDLVQKNL